MSCTAFRTFYNNLAATPATEATLPSAGCCTSTLGSAILTCTGATITGINLSSVTAGPLAGTLGSLTGFTGLTSFSLAGQANVAGTITALPAAAAVGGVTLDLSGSGITQISPAALANVAACTPSTGLCVTGLGAVENLCQALPCAGISSSLPLSSSLSTRIATRTGGAGAAPTGTDIVPAPIPTDPQVIASVSQYILGTTTTTSTTRPWTGLPQNSFAIDTKTNVLWYALAGIAGASLIILSALLLVSWRQKSGRLSRAATLKRSLSRRGQGDDLAHLNPALLAPGVRNHSLADNRASNNDDALANAKEFISANGGKDEFPVVRPHAKTTSDELSLVQGDKVVLTRAFADGWAEGVSRRAGGPAVFPISCLGGSVPGILVRRYEQQVGMMGGGYGGYGGAHVAQQGAHAGYGVHHRGGY
ncbi:hypothetical protein HK097_007186 [Rhizophlyctis rosea]|uniref:SH3 domain-containing protein n=1 Tax=Rhizophlyctis rosea TaxID=64517 RepID=A0AAD5X629_9FUNG|nr:hypothetical protein HK097_007186 [Rhizophlyctis rosea]